MNLTEIFAAYYVQYRAEATTPTSTDDEWTIAVRLFNEAISRWSNYDGTYWKELFTTAQVDSTGAVLTLATGVATYAAPTAMREAGGSVKLYNASSVLVQYFPIIEPQDVQFQSEEGTFCYFTGNPSSGFTLHLNKTPDASINGFTIDYVYYKKPTLLTTANTTTEMADPYFMVHRALANRFRVSRNPHYQTAKVDAEDALRTMQLDNNSGSWANPFSLPDRSGTSWGA